MLNICYSKKVLRNYFALNLLLILIAAFLGIRLHNVLTSDIEIPTKATAISPRKIENKHIRKGAHSDSLSYDVITSKNLFHPSRSSMNKKPLEIAQPVTKSEIPQLFGTIITNEKKLAILEDRTTKKSNLYKVNASVSGFIVSQILENKVILLNGGESIEVDLRADKKFKAPKRIQARRKTIRKAPERRRRLQRRRPPVRRSSGR